MNKYLKTYIRNRDIAIENKQNPKEYELDYIDTGNLNSEGIYDLISSSIKKNGIEINTLINKLLNNQTLIGNIDSDGIHDLLFYSEKPDNIINKLLNNKKFITNLMYKGIKFLLDYSSEPQMVIDILGDKGKEFIDNVNLNTIKDLLDYSTAPDKIKQIIKKYRPDIK